MAREGRAGGYRLARPAEQITLAQVYQAAKVAYQQEPTTGGLPSNLRVQTMLNEVADQVEQALLATLDRYTIAALMEETGEAGDRGDRRDSG